MDKDHCPDKHPWDEHSKFELYALAKYHEARADQLEKIVMTAVCGEPDQVHRIEYGAAPTEPIHRDGDK